jgi:uncharacterized membrane protein
MAIPFAGLMGFLSFAPLSGYNTTALELYGAIPIALGIYLIVSIFLRDLRMLITGVIAALVSIFMTVLVYSANILS